MEYLADNEKGEPGRNMANQHNMENNLVENLISNDAVSSNPNPELRKYTIGISILLIAYGAASVTIGMGVLAFMSMDTALQPEPCLPLVITPVLLLLMPCMIGLIRLKEWSI